MAKLLTESAILADLLLTHTLQLQRLSSRENIKMQAILKNLAKELAAKTVMIDPTAPGQRRYRTARAAKLMSEARRIVSEKFTEALDGFEGTMTDLANLEAEFVTKSLSKATGLTFTNTIPATQMRAIVNEGYVQGALLKDWFSRASQDYVIAFQREINLGMTAGESVDKMVRRIIGNKRDFTDGPGLYEKRKRGTEALVRTAVMNTSNEARMAAFRANDDVIKGYQWLATLDSRTCTECGALDGKIWDKEGHPIGHTFEFQEPPAHISCRCVLSPLTALGDSLAQIQDGRTRASMDGQVSRSMTFEDWFATKDAAFQEKYLGKGRYELYKDGKITFEDLITQRGRPLTIEELKAEATPSISLSAGKGDTDGYSIITGKEPFDIKDNDAIESTFNKFAQDISDSDIEKAIVISPDGYRYDIDGNKRFVNVEIIGKNSLIGATEIHNHPGEDADSFSKDDFIGFFESGSAAMEVVYNGKRNRMEWVGERLTGVEAHRVYEDAFIAVQDNAIKNKTSVQAEHYEIMRYLQKNLKGLRFYEL